MNTKQEAELEALRQQWLDSEASNSELRTANAKLTAELEALRAAAAVSPKKQPSFNTESDCEKNHRECEAPELCQKFGRCCGA